MTPDGASDRAPNRGIDERSFFENAFNVSLTLSHTPSA
jgi:hypothetical protein